MHVLFATMQFGRGYSQGTERYLNLLRTGLAARGVTSTVLAGDPERRGAPLPLGAPIDSGGELLSYPARGWMATRGLPPERLDALLEQTKPDVVHLVNPGFIGVGLLSAAQRRGIPCVVTVVDYWWLCPKHTLRHFERGVCDGQVPWRECLACIAAERAGSLRAAVARLPVLRDLALPPAYFARWLIDGVPVREIARWTRRQRFLLRELDSADAVIFLSQTARELIGPRLAHADARLIRNGLEPHWFRNDAPRTPPSDPRELVIGYAGALAPHKGAHRVLEALHKLGWTQTRVRIAGGGDDARYRAELQRLGQGLRVEWLGALRGEAMPPFYRSLDVLIVPSAWLENLPMVVYEALASRVPVLASRMPGVAEFVPDARLLFDPRDADDLARCLAAWHAAPPAPTWPRVSRADEMTTGTLAVYEAVGAPLPA